MKMAKRHYTGHSFSHQGVHNRRQIAMPTYTSQNHTVDELRTITNMATSFFWTIYTVMTGKYITIATIIVMVMLSYFLPDISHKIHATNELKAMKKVLNAVTNEVARAEAACLTVADEICNLHCSMQDGCTETTKDLRDLAVCTSKGIRPTQSEPVQVEKKIGFLRRIFFTNKNASHKEIAIMSYVYTDSFDAKKS